MANVDSKTALLDHSEAKVKLYRKYLSIYLNVLSRANMEKIYLFDLFCGEGRYEDGGEGSPLAALECIKDHYYSNNETCPNIEIIFNDAEKSKIEPEKFKTQRIEEFANAIFRPSTVRVHYSNLEYSELLPRVINKVNRLRNSERALLFIDPWGYKEIDPEDLKKLIGNGKVEIILFLPIYFMYRFANKSILDKNFRGGQALRDFMLKLFGSIQNVPHISSQQDLIYKLQQQFKKYLSIKYVDVFKIERESNNWFCLYFFTKNKTGFHKMLDAKWSIDRKSGNSFKIGNESTIAIFDELEISDYPNKVLNYLLSNSGATNLELLDFGLEHNFLPKHTKQVLDELSKKYTMAFITLDGKPALSYYIGNNNRLIKIVIQ